MLQTTIHNRHNWKDMKYKNKRDSNSHVKNQAKIGENLKILFATNATKRAIQDVHLFPRTCHRTVP